MVHSARERLQLFDVPEHQIRELEASRKIKKSLHIHTPVPGTVIRIGSRQGQYVTPKTELYMIVDLNQVWVYADVYEYELPWVKVDDKVEMTLASVPGKVFSGSLAYIYPYAESKTRTTKVRLVFDNPDLLLRPDMFADVVIKSDNRENAIVIPSEAVIRSGSTTQVFVKRGPGKFEPRIVTLGVDSRGEVAVLEGLKEGEEVVTSAQFLVDSESKLNEATAKMMETLNAGKKDQAITNSTDNVMQGNDSQNTDHSDMDMGPGGTDMEGMEHGGTSMENMSDGNMEADVEQMDHSKMEMTDDDSTKPMTDHGNHDND
jgi:Cu(I)/Ag(I) efflux system membrane fusion protein